MKEMYELYKNSLKGHKKETIEKVDKEILKISQSFAEQEWFLINGGYDGIEYIDGMEVCHLPYIEKVGFYPTRKEQNKPTFGELKALCFYVMHKDRLEALGECLNTKLAMIKSSSKQNLGPESDIARIMIESKEREKELQLVK